MEQKETEDIVVSKPLRNNHNQGATQCKNFSDKLGKTGVLTSLLGKPARLSFTAAAAPGLGIPVGMRSGGWWNLQVAPKLHSPVFI